MPYVWFIFTLCSTFVSISIHIVCTWHIDFQFSGVWTHCYPVLDCAVWSNPNDYTHMQMRWIGGYECKMIYGSKWLDHRTKHSRDHPDIKYACANIYNIYHILTFACTYYIFTHTHIYIYNNILQFPCDLVHLNCVKWSFKIFQDHLCFTLGKDTIVVYGNAMFVNTFKHTRTHVNWLRCSYLIYNAYVCIQVISQCIIYIYSSIYI